MAQALLLVGFHAPWCGACRLLEPVLTRIAAEDDAVTLRRVDVAREPGLAERMGVSSLPTLVVLNEREQECRRLTGAMTGSRIRAALDSVRATDVAR